MKILEIIQEARRNPELNPKLSAYEQIKARYDATTDYIDAETKNLFANFLGIDKIGVNPRHAYNTTPTGIYAYPVKYILDEVPPGYGMDYLPYAGDEKFINVFNVDFTNILNVNESTSQEHIKKIIQIYIDETGKSFDEAVNIIVNCVKNSNNTLYNVIKLLVRCAFDETVWPYKRVKKDEDDTPNFRETTRLTSLLRKLGFDGVYDQGHGDIHRHEPAQLGIINPKAIKNNQRILNKKYYDYREYGERRRNMINDFLPVLKSGDHDKIIDFIRNAHDPKILVDKIKDPVLRQKIIQEFPKIIFYTKKASIEEKLYAISLHIDKLLEIQGLTVPVDESFLILAIERLPIENYIINTVSESKLTNAVKIALIKKKPNLIFKLKKPSTELISLAAPRIKQPTFGTIYTYKASIDYFENEIPKIEQKIAELRKEKNEFMDRLVPNISDKLKFHINANISSIEWQIQSNLKKIDKAYEDYKEAKHRLALYKKLGYHNENN